MKNKSEQAFMRNQLLLALIEPEAFNTSPDFHDITELDECDKDIHECREMLQYYISVGDSTEIKSRKCYLQEAKTRKRMIRKMIDEHTNERELLTA